MKIKKNELINTFAQSIGIQAARELITKKINAADLKDKEDYTEEEIARICGELTTEGDLIRIIAQSFLIQSEHKRAEEQTLLLDNIETLIWYATDIETYGAVNKACADFLGKKKKDIEGKNIYNLLSKKEAEICVAGNREIFEKRKQIHTEEWVTNSKGEKRLLSVTKTPKLDANGNVEYAVCAAEDITERRQVEEALRESETRYRNIFNSATDSFLIFDMDGNIVEANPQACKMYGYSHDELIKLSGKDIVHPDYYHLFEQFKRDVQATGEFHTESIDVHKDGTQFHIEVKGTEFDYRGKKHLLAVIRDITERKKKEADLQSQRRTLESLLKNSPLGIVTSDKNNKIISCNPMFEEIFQYKESEIIGKDIDKLIATGELIKEAREITKKTSIDGIPSKITTKRKRKDGTLVNVEIFAVPVKIEDKLSGQFGIYQDITERKEAGEALQESETMYRSLYDTTLTLADETALDAVIRTIADRLTAFLKASDCAVYLLDPERKILVPIYSNDIKDRGAIMAYEIPLGQGLSGRVAQTGTGEYINFREDNNYTIHIPGTDRTEDENESVICIPMFDGADILGVLTIGRLYEEFDEIDIEKLTVFARQAEMAIKRARNLQALQISEERYRTLQANIPVGILRTSPEGMFISANPAFIKMLGYDSEEEILTTSALDTFVIPEQYQKFIKRVNAERSVVDFEVELRRKNGSTFWGSLSTTAVTDKAGKVIHYDSILKDITKRKKAEEALAAEKERLAVTLASIGDGVITTDTEGKVVLINKVAEKLIGMKEKDAIGKPLDKIFHIINEKTRKRCENPVDKVLGIKKTLDITNHTILIARDNTERIIAYSSAPIHDKTGEIIGVVLVFRDTTEKRKMEKELLKTTKLESVGILAGGIAHDYNNILMAILGNITLAKKLVKPEDEILEILTQAEEASLRMKDLSQQLLTFAKGGVPVKRTASISELIKKSSSFILRGSNAWCEFSMPDDLWSVEIDTGQINQVINNLIINAKQAMPEGGTIEVCGENITIDAKHLIPLRKGKYVKISIKDHGIGISEEHLQKIFDPYFTTKQEGSGLGLTTSYSIIKKHNGLITVKSKLGVGTTFYIYLLASKEGPFSKKRVKKKLFVGKGKILVMDDKKTVREVADRMLKHMGYEVVVAKDGAEAIELYKRARESNQPFDVVIMDLTVPKGMGGKAAIKKFLEIDPEVKAIVSSGYSNDPIMSNFKKYGFKDIIVKPYKIEELSETLEKVLNS